MAKSRSALWYNFTMSIHSAHPAAKPILHAIRQARATHRLFTGGPLLVAVSGGADSGCLLHALWTLAQEADQQTDQEPTLPLHVADLHVAHLDHALRPGSAGDAAFVADLAARWGLPCHSRRLPENFLRDQPGNLEANARRARYNFLREIAEQIDKPLRQSSVKAPSSSAAQSPISNLQSPISNLQSPISALTTVATAHHADDQAETLLLHLLRGSGLRGLAGMRPLSEWPLGDLAGSDAAPAPRLVRPLLDVTRAQILAYLHAHDLPWRDDPTNRDESPVRNRLRQRVLPLLAEINPSVTQTLARSAQILADEADRAASANERAFDEALVEQTPCRVILDVTVARQFDMATQRGLLQRAGEAMQPAAAKHGIANEDATFAQIETLRRALANNAVSGPHPLGRGLAWTIFADEAGSPRLSLHCADARPLAPRHPYLDTAWPKTGVPIQPNHSIDAGDWSLRATLLDRAALLASWNAPVAGLTWQALLDAERAQNLTLTTPRVGMRVAPLGMGGQHKTLGDFFTDAKVPAALRPGWPLVVDGNGEILWVGGFAPSHPARIRPTTEKILHLLWRLRDREGR